MAGEGVRADPEKLDAMQRWPLPKDLKGLRGFLGLTGYYRRFIQSYGIIAQPLTQMLKKGAFQWTDKARAAFESLKHALMTAPVLTLLDLNKTFTVETDACDVGVGAMLGQDGHPIAYMSKALTKMARKTFGYDFKIEYKKGPENTAADSLSRLTEQLMTLSVVETDIWERGNVLYRKNRAVIPPNSGLRQELLHHFHDTLAAGHEEEKHEAIKPPGHLNPFPIPSKPWNDITMDFIDAMPRSEGKEAILVVVDRLTKYSHFAPLPRSYQGPMVASVYQEYVGKLHGMPQSVVCDRDSIFLSAFWQEYMKKMGTTLNFSTAHHP
ncbi:uncharacterized protein LOC116252624 [Nymphaea colorata]|uniref:uncharacterized protein LOC116252624 n=1 Tax=Nymphaea colorata TaxID=210225 RepID=UPI00129DC56F|nr:uncharacterized protein LOC116252624 [Nymphaea colorata]